MEEKNERNMKRYDERAGTGMDDESNEFKDYGSP